MFNWNNITISEFLMLNGTTQIIAIIIAVIVVRYLIGHSIRMIRTRVKVILLGAAAGSMGITGTNVTTFLDAYQDGNMMDLLNSIMVLQL